MSYYYKNTLYNPTDSEGNNLNWARIQAAIMLANIESDKVFIVPVDEYTVTAENTLTATFDVPQIIQDLANFADAEVIESVPDITWALVDSTGATHAAEATLTSGKYSVVTSAAVAANTIITGVQLTIGSVTYKSIYDSSVNVTITEG